MRAAICPPARAAAQRHGRRQRSLGAGQPASQPLTIGPDGNQRQDSGQSEKTRYVSK